MFKLYVNLLRAICMFSYSYRSNGDINYLPRIVAENADSPATLQYLAPYTGAALAEYFSAT